MKKSRNFIAFAIVLVAVLCFLLLSKDVKNRLNYRDCNTITDSAIVKIRHGFIIEPNTEWYTYDKDSDIITFYSSELKDSIWGIYTINELFEQTSYGKNYLNSWENYTDEELRFKYFTLDGTKDTLIACVDFFLSGEKANKVISVDINIGCNNELDVSFNGCVFDVKRGDNNTLWDKEYDELLLSIKNKIDNLYSKNYSFIGCSIKKDYEDHKYLRIDRDYKE